MKNVVGPCFRHRICLGKATVTAGEFPGAYRAYCSFSRGLGKDAHATAPLASFLATRLLSALYMPENLMNPVKA